MCYKVKSCCNGPYFTGDNILPHLGGDMTRPRTEDNLKYLHWLEIIMRSSWSQCNQDLGTAVFVIKEKLQDNITFQHLVCNL